MRSPTPTPPLRARSDESLSPHQIETLVILERIGGSLSLASVLLIFIAYWLVRRVRNVQNTFIVFASVSNIGASVGSIIAYDGLARGKMSTLCQAQSFLFEMFMQSDPWWALAMAINVFLVFYFHTSPDSFRRLWWIYCLICYGGPFVIALALLLIRVPAHGPIFGEATIWCWVDRDWDFIRIYTYYMLIWICIVGSILCYFLVGYHVFRTRNQLRSFSTSKNQEKKELDSVRYPSIVISQALAKIIMEQARIEMAQQGFYGTVTTEVQVIHSQAFPSEPNNCDSTRDTTNTNSFNPFEKIDAPELQAVSTNHFVSSVTTTAPEAASHLSMWSRLVGAMHSFTGKFHVNDPIKRAYLRTSFLFAISVLVTWIPSSLNRIHGWLMGTSPYDFHVATAAVLPLQGLWNGIIFFVTSWGTLSKWWKNTLLDEDAIMSDQHMSENVAINERRGGPHDGLDTSDMDDVDSVTVGSDAELRRGSDAVDKKSSNDI